MDTCTKLADSLPERVDPHDTLELPASNLVSLADRDRLRPCDPANVARLRLFQGVYFCRVCLLRTLRTLVRSKPTCREMCACLREATLPTRPRPRPCLTKRPDPSGPDKCRLIVARGIVSPSHHHTKSSQNVSSNTASSRRYSTRMGGTLDYLIRTTRSWTWSVVALCSWSWSVSTGS